MKLWLALFMGLVLASHVFAFSLSGSRPIPCSTCGFKPTPTPNVGGVIYNSGNVCWNFYNLAYLWGKNPYLESLCGKSDYQPQCAATEIRAAKSGLPLCANNKLLCGLECTPLKTIKK